MSSQGSSGVAAESPATETEDRLKAWGHWLRTIGALPGLTRQDLLRREGSPSISDDEGLLIDGIVCRLIERNYRMGVIVRDAYWRNKSDQEMGIEWRSHRNTIAKIREAGIMWIDGVLEGLEE